MLDKNTKDRIERDADNVSRIPEFQSGYERGATAEAERAQGLVECLNSIKAIGHPDKRVLNLIDEALTKYNNLANP